MIGGGFTVVGSLVHQAGSFASSLPDVVLYGGATILGGLFLIGLLSASRSTSSKEERSASETESISANQTSSSDSESVPAADDDEVATGTSRVSESETSNDSPQDEETESEPQTPEKPSATQFPKQVVVKETSDQATVSRRTIRSEAGREGENQSQLSHSVPNTRLQLLDRHSSEQKQFRQHLVDGVDVNTGFDWVSTDNTWSVGELDLGMNAVSIDTSGELVYIDPIPSLVSYDLVDSPIDISSPSILQLLLGKGESQSNAEPQVRDSEKIENKRLRQEEDTVANSHHSTRQTEQGELSPPTNRHSKGHEKGWASDSNSPQAHSSSSHSRAESPHIGQRTDRPDVTSFTGRDWFGGEQSPVGSEFAVDADELTFDDPFQITDHPEDVSRRLEEEVEQMNQRIQKQREELRENLGFERNDGYQPQVEVPRLQDPGFNKESSNSRSGLIDPGSEKRGLFGGMTREPRLFEEAQHAWGEDDQRGSTFGESNRVGVEESVFSFDEWGGSPFEVNDSDIGPDAGSNTMFPEVDEMVPDNEWEDAESRFGLW